MSARVGLRCTVALLVGGLLSSACSNAVFRGASSWSTDGPVMVSGLTSRSGRMEALIAGTVSIDADCIELRRSESDSRPGDAEPVGIGWPAGTSWDEAEEAVVLADGRRIRHGDSISGGGGGFPVIDSAELHPNMTEAVEKCDAGTVVLFNGDPGDIEIG